MLQAFEDRRLIGKYNRGQTEVLAKIYEKYKDRLVTLATALLFDKTAAEDIVHEVFVTFIRLCGRTRIRENLKCYLAAGVANAARSRNRRADRQHGVSLEQVGEIAAPDESLDFGLLFGEQQRRLGWALSRVPYEQREVVVLHVCTGLTFRAIARMQDRSVNTIQGRYRYGMDKLKSLLNGEMET